MKTKKIKLKAKAVIFDMDGVITNTMPDHFRAWKKVFKKIGLQANHYDVYKREGQRGLTSLKEIFAEKGIPFDLKTAKDLLRMKEALFKKIVKVRLIRGARNLLECLSQNQFSLALVTGTSRHEMIRILPKDLFDLFDCVITGCDVQHGKPNPEPFLKAVRRLKISSSSAVVIENAPLGIKSAKRAGLKCIALTTSLDAEYLKQADYVYPSIGDMRKAVEFIRS